MASDNLLIWDKTIHLQWVYATFFFLFCCSINGVSPKVRKILQLFRLLQIHNGVFIKLNKATMNMLRVVQPYVAYGLVQLFFFSFGCIKYMYCAWFSHISLCKEHPMWHLVGWPSLALSEWLLELSVLETHHSWCLFLAMSLEIKTAHSVSFLGNWFGVVHCIFLVLPRVTLWPWLGR